MEDKNVQPNSQQGGEKTPTPSEDLGKVYQPPTGDTGSEDQNPTGELGENQEGQETNVGNGKQEGLTEERISELIEQGIARGMRTFQSMTDKNTERLKKMIIENENRVKRIIGRDLTQDEKIALEGNVREEIINNQEANEQGNSQNQAPFEPSEEVKREFANKVQALEIRYGERLYREDEETKTVNWNETDHIALLKQIESAIKAKAGRNLPSEDSESGAQSRLPQGSNDKKPSNLNNKTPGQLLEEAYPRVNK